MSIRMRHTRGHTGNRRSHHALKGIRAVKNEAGALALPHRLDEATGTYRGKQIFTPKAKRERAPKAKGPSAEPALPHAHEHAHAEHTNAEVKSSKGIFGKITRGIRPKARSGMGGQAS